MRFSTFVAVFLAAGILPAAPAAPTPTERLQTLAQSMIFGWAKQHPLTATALGLSDYDGELDTPSEAENRRDLATIRGWESELASIPLDGASLVDVDDAKLLRAQLVGYERQYLVYKNFEKDPSGPSLAIVGAIYVQFLHLPIAGTAGATQTDVAAAWEKIIERLAGAPAYIAAGNALVTHPGHLYGVTGAEQLAGAPSLLGGPLTDAAKAQLPADRFAAFGKARDAPLTAIAADQEVHRRACGIVARELRDRTRRLRRDAARRATAAVQLRRHRAHGARRAGARMGRTDLDGSNSPPSVARRSGRRVAAAWPPGAPR